MSIIFPRRVNRWLLSAAAVWLLCAPASAGNRAEVHSDWGPFAAYYTDIEGNKHFRAAGPLLEWVESPDGKRFFAFRPFYSSVKDPVNELQRKDFLWPVGESRHRFNTFSWRFLLAMGWDYDDKNPGSQYRTWILPFYYQGRTAKGENYFALWPFYASQNDFLGRDHIGMVLFPFYLSTEINDVKSKTILWPFFSKTKGDDLGRLRIFPFYGHSYRGDQFRRTFICWPFWTSATYPKAGGGGFMLFPLYGQLKLPNESTHWVLPPFFKFSRGGKTETTHVFWPLYQRSTGENEKHVIFPLIGYKRIGNVERRFFLWPIFWHDKITRTDHTLERRFALPFVYTDVRRDVDGNTMGSYQKLWPLISRRADGDAVRWRVVDLWPLKQSGPIERNYAPLWTLYSHYHDADSSETELLWGLYRRVQSPERGHRSIFPLIEWDREEGQRSWALLKGLIGREKQAKGSSWKFLYVFRFGGD